MLTSTNINAVQRESSQKAANRKIHIWERWEKKREHFTLIHEWVNKMNIYTLIISSWISAPYYFVWISFWLIILLSSNFVPESVRRAWSWTATIPFLFRLLFPLQPILHWPFSNHNNCFLSPQCVHFRWPNWSWSSYDHDIREREREYVSVCVLFCFCAFLVWLLYSTIATQLYLIGSC